MTTITPEIGEQYQIADQIKPKFNKELGQDEFLELMMAQLKHQDPMKPMDNGEFLGQMAQFSTVTGIEGMQTALENLTATYASSQTLQSSQLVGKEVLVESSSMELSDDRGANGSFELEASSGDVLLDISNSQGTVVRQMQMGEFSQGRHSFSWDGLDNQGLAMPAGTYKVQVTAQYGNEFAAAPVLTNRVVESVEFGAGGQTLLNTRQGDVLTLADIKQIRESSTTASELQQ